MSAAKSSVPARAITPASSQPRASCQVVGWLRGNKIRPMKMLCIAMPTEITATARAATVARRLLHRRVSR